MARVHSREGGAAIIGDVAVEDVKVDPIGGSLRATLRKPLRSPLGEVGSHMSGATLTFGDDAACIIIAPEHDDGDPGSSRSKIRVTRVSPRRFMIDLEDGTDENVDPMTQAFLDMLVEQFKAGKRPLVGQDEAMRVLAEIEDTLDPKQVAEDSAA